VGCPSSRNIWTMHPGTGVTGKLNVIPMPDDVQYVVRDARLDTERQSSIFDVLKESIPRCNRLNNWLTLTSRILLEKLVVS
jgi:hypothetical protein